MSELLEKRKALHQRVEDVEEKCRALEESLSGLQPLANLGLVWAMTAHELNNLLMPILNYSQLALQNPQDTALSEKALRKSLLLSERAKDVMEKVMMLAHPEQCAKSEKEDLSFNSILDNVFTCIGRDFEKDGIRVTRQVSDSIQFKADRTMIQQVFMNLLLNARHAMLTKGGQLMITAEETTDGTFIQISDTGSGIDPEKLKDIFSPFCTFGKTHGNGLGLAFCRKVIEHHDGCITVDSRPQSGTRFKILLPKYPA